MSAEKNFVDPLSFVDMDMRSTPIPLFVPECYWPRDLNLITLLSSNLPVMSSNVGTSHVMKLIHVKRDIIFCMTFVDDIYYYLFYVKNSDPDIGCNFEYDRLWNRNNDTGCKMKQLDDNNKFITFMKLKGYGGYGAGIEYCTYANVTAKNVSESSNNQATIKLPFVTSDKRDDNRKCIEYYGLCVPWSDGSLRSAQVYNSCNLDQILQMMLCWIADIGGDVLNLDEPNERALHAAITMISRTDSKNFHQIHLAKRLLLQDAPSLHHIIPNNKSVYDCKGELWPFLNIFQSMCSRVISGDCLHGHMLEPCHVNTLPYVINYDGTVLSQYEMQNVLIAGTESFSLDSADDFPEKCEHNINGVCCNENVKRTMKFTNSQPFLIPFLVHGYDNQIFPDFLVLGGHDYELGSVVVNISNTHFISIIKTGSQWFYYEDLGQEGGTMTSVDSPFDFTFSDKFSIVAVIYKTTKNTNNIDDSHIVGTQECKPVGDVETRHKSGLPAHRLPSNNSSWTIVGRSKRTHKVRIIDNKSSHVMPVNIACNRSEKATKRFTPNKQITSQSQCYGLSDIPLEISNIVTHQSKPSSCQIYEHVNAKNSLSENIKDNTPCVVIFQKLYDHYSSAVKRDQRWFLKLSLMKRQLHMAQYFTLRKSLEYKITHVRDKINTWKYKPSGMRVRSSHKKCGGLPTKNMKTKKVRKRKSDDIDLTGNKVAHEKKRKKVSEEMKLSVSGGIRNQKRLMDNQQFKRYNNEDIDTIVDKYETLKTAIENNKDGDIGSLVKQMKFTERRLVFAKSLKHQREKKQFERSLLNKCNDKVEKLHLQDVMSVVTGIVNIVCLGDMENIEYFIVHENLKVTANWFDNTVEKYFKNAIDNMKPGVQRKIQYENDLRRDIISKLKHLMLCRRADGIKLNDAIYKVQIRRKKAHLQLRYALQVNPDLDKEEFLKREYGHSKCHHKYNEVYGYDKEATQYYTADEFDMLEANILTPEQIADQIELEHSAKTKRTFRLCDETCSNDLDFDWGIKLHVALDTMQVTEKGAVKNDISLCDMIAAVDEFITCDQCELSDYKYKHCPMKDTPGSPSCTDNVLLLRTLRPHYKGIRTLMNSIYDITTIFKRLDVLNRSFLTGQYESMIDIYNKYDINSSDELKPNNEEFENREQIHNFQNMKSKFAHMITPWKDRLSSKYYPKYECKICHRMLSFEGMLRKKVTLEELRAINSPVGGLVADLIVKENPSYVVGEYMMCTCCWNAVKRENMFPPYCSLNNFRLEPLPDEMTDMTDFEVVLVSKVRSIKKMISLQKLSQKCWDMGNLLKGVRGGAIHMSMPFEENMEHVIEELPSLDNVCFLVNQIRSEASKYIRQNFVRFDKLTKVIVWLIKNHKWYGSVRLVDHSELFNQLFDSIKTVEMKENQLIQLMPPAPDIRNIDYMSEEDQLLIPSHFILKPDNLPSALQNSITDIFQHKRIKGPIIYANHPGVDVMSFPEIYPYGTGGLNDPERKSGEHVKYKRNIKQNYYFSAMMSQKDPRARRHMNFLMDSVLRRESSQIGYGMWRIKRTGPFKQLNCKGLNELIHKNDAELNYNINKIQSLNRGSSAFWSEEYKKLKALDEAHGPASLFVTLSCAEYSWGEDLGDYLRFVNSDLPCAKNIELSRLCHKDPISVMKFFQMRFDLLMSVVIAPGIYKIQKPEPTPGIFGTCLHYYWRLEFQARGAPHVHMKLWIEGCPIVGVDSDETINKWIAERITCRLPDQILEQELYNLVTTFQTHKCGTYCQRKYKTRKGMFNSYCKQGFGNGEGRPIVHKARLLSMELVQKSRKKNPKRIAQILRKNSERLINDYHPLLMYFWRANVDVQFIGESSQMLNHYITGYITKAESSCAADILANMDVSKYKSSEAVMRSIAAQMNKSKEVGAYEACVKTLGMAYSGSDVAVVPTTLGQSKERHGKLRPLKFLNDPANSNKSVICANVINQYYPYRPFALEHLSLYEALTEWLILPDLPKTYEEPIDDVTEKCLPTTKKSSKSKKSTKKSNMIQDYADPIMDEQFSDGGTSECYRFTYPFDDVNVVGYYVKKNKKNLIRYNNCQLNSHDENDRYYFKLLQLYKPWRVESDIIGDEPSYHAAFVKAMTEFKKLNLIHTNTTFFDQQLEIAKKNEEALAEDDYYNEIEDIEKHALDIPDTKTITEKIQEMKKIANMNRPKNTSETLLASMVDKLNVAQTRIYHKIMNYMAHINDEHDGGNCTCETQLFKPIRLFVSGVAGTGKSFLIKTIVMAMHLKYSTDDDLASVIVLAPTGLAAWNVGGITLHKYFKLNVSHGGMEQPLSNLGPEDIKSFLGAYKNVRLIIVDEISMISNATLAKLDHRLSVLYPITKKTPNKHLPHVNLFGSRSILMLGDLLQLPPVSRAKSNVHIFRQFKSNDKFIQKILNVMFVPDLWGHFEYDELTENMRQKDDETFMDLLNAIRIGSPTEDHINTLTTCLIKCNSYVIGDVAREFQKEYNNDNGVVALFPTCVKVKSFNNIMLTLEAIETVEIHAIDTEQVSDSSKRKNNSKRKRYKMKEDINESETAGLLTILKVGKNARIMLRRNLDPSIGLVNGAMGNIEHINFSLDKKTVESLTVRFDNDNTGLVEIERLETCFDSGGGVYINRKQFPIILSYAITIHKSQGLTLPKVYLDLSGNLHAQSMAYVALSRTRKLTDLRLIAFDPTQFVCDSQCIEQYNVLRTKFNDGNPELPQLPMFEYHNMLPDRYAHQQRIYTANLKDAGTIDNAVLAKTDSTPVVYEPYNRAIVFSNYDGECCYANALVQLLLSSILFCDFVKKINVQPLDGAAKFVDKFVKLHMLNKVPPNYAVSLDALRETVSDAFERGTYFQCSLEFLCGILSKFVGNNNKWLINSIETVTYECCDYKRVSRSSQHSLTLYLPSLVKQKNVSWSLLKTENQINSTNETYCSQCNTDDDINAYKKQLQSDNTDHEHEQQQQFIDWMLKEHGVKSHTHTQIEIHEDLEFLFVDISVREQYCMIDLPQYNDYMFDAIPGKKFTLVGVVQFINEHYYATVCRDGVWYQLDCSRTPHIKEVLPINDKIDNVSIMLFEENLHQLDLLQLNRLQLRTFQNKVDKVPKSLKKKPSNYNKRIRVVDKLLTFSNNLSESCYANAIVQVLLCSSDFCKTITDSVHEETYKNVTKEFSNLVTLNETPTSSKVSLDSFRAAVHSDFAPGSHEQSSHEFLCSFLQHYPSLDQHWSVYSQTKTTYPCCNYTHTNNDKYHTLSYPHANIDDNLTWDNFVKQVIPDQKSQTLSYCSRCNTTEMITQSQKKFINKDGIYDNNQQKKFEEWMIANNGIMTNETIVRSTSDQLKFLFIDIPTMGIMKITDLPLDGNYVFPTIPLLRFKLIGLVIYTPGHYYSIVNKKNIWYKLDCIKKPHAIRIKALTHVFNAAIMMFEKI